MQYSSVCGPDAIERGVTSGTASGTLRRSSHHHSNSSYDSHGNGNKIATISRHVVELRNNDTNQVPNQVHSILKTSNTKETSSHSSSSNSHNNVLKASGNGVVNPPSMMPN